MHHLCHDFFVRIMPNNERNRTFLANLVTFDQNSISKMVQNINQSIGDNIKKIRTLKGLDAKTIADHLGIYRPVLMPE
jgi:hypothetical protein